MLIAFAGLPGCGKTTVARLLAQRLRAVHLRIDAIEQALRASTALKDDVGPAGYLIGYAVAEDNLRLGRIVIADSVNPISATRVAWRGVAERAAVSIAEVEILCSDATEHRRRVETRASDIEGLALPDWQKVVQRSYEAWDRQPIVADTAVKSPGEVVDALVLQLGLEGSRTSAT